MKTGTFINDAGDSVILDYHTATSKAYEEAGYRLHEDSDAVTAAAQTAAQVLSDGILNPDAPASENARSRDPEDAPADPSAVAYPAGQIPQLDETPPVSHDITPISDKTMQDSQPKDDGSGPKPLVDSYETPPTPGRNPTPAAREAQRLENAEKGIVDERGVHEHKEGESSSDPAKSAGEVATPEDLKASNVVEESQGTSRPGPRRKGS